MQRFFQVIWLFYCYYLTHCLQPYFPPQVVFTVNNGQLLYAIDQVNQRAFVSINDSLPQSAYVFQHFPYSPAGTPQAKSYVQLATSLNSSTCDYGTYWEYGGYSNNFFPAHWDNKTSFQILNYLNLPYTMVPTRVESDNADEDHWQSEEMCYGEIQDVRPCFQIYFEKNTDIPLRSIALKSVGNRQIFETTEYQVISTGKPDDKYFAGIPENWYTSCLDLNLQVKYFADIFVVGYESYTNVSVSLSAPPHRLNGNDSVTIQWNFIGCHSDCLTWTPQQLTFNSHNFNRKQILTFYRVFDSGATTFTPIFIGGGFDHVPPELNTFSFEPS